MTQPEYGTPQITRHAPTVSHAPDRIRIPLAMLDALAVADTDVVYLGHTADGQPVHYRITGWDADAQALTAERATR